MIHKYDSYWIVSGIEFVDFDAERPVMLYGHFVPRANNGHFDIGHFEADY